MILLWGMSGDDPFEAIRASLARRGEKFLVLDQSPSIALNPYGGVVVVWSRRQGADFELAMASRPTSGSWSQHALLTYNTTSD